MPIGRAITMLHPPDAENIRDFQGAELHFSGLRVLTPEALLKEI
jgi:hypothetical protein